MRGVEALFPDFDQLVEAENELTDKLDGERRKYASRKASGTQPSQMWLQELQERRFEEPEELSALVDWVLAALDASNVQMTHPGYLGLFNPHPVFAAECADRIAAAFNPQVCVHSHAPAAVEIERHVIEQVAVRAGLPKGSGGHFTSGGAEANMTAVLCALYAKCPSYGEDGLFAFSGQPTIYTSKESHLAWLKIAHATGIGRTAVRLVQTDGTGKMEIASLEHAIEQDIALGFVPTLIIATAGTTNAGMIDPLSPCRDLADKYRLWFHIDAAWGGGLIASELKRPVLSGIELADSITIDAHKWFATTMGTGMFLTPQSHVLSQVFRVSTTYMPQSEGAKDYYIQSNQWSRRFLGLRLFLALGTAGWSGYSEYMEEAIRLSERLSKGLSQAGWLQANSSPLAVTCMVPPEGHDAVDHYVDAVNADGSFWISKAIFEGKPVLRACVTNGRTDEKNIDGLVDLLISLQRLKVRP